MKRKDTLSLGEFRAFTADMPDDAAIMIVSDTLLDNTALAVQLYPIETSLDRQGVILLQQNIYEAVTFSE